MNDNGNWNRWDCDYDFIPSPSLENYANNNCEIDCGGAGYGFVPHNYDTEWSMEEDYTEWSPCDIADWLALLHSDLEQHGQRAQFLKIDGEKFVKLKDPKYLREDIGIELESHVNAIVTAVTRRMDEYDRRKKETNGAIGRHDSPKHSYPQFDDEYYDNYGITSSDGERGVERVSFPLNTHVVWKSMIVDLRGVETNYKMNPYFTGDTSNMEQYDIKQPKPQMPYFGHPKPNLKTMSNRFRKS